MEQWYKLWQYNKKQSKRWIPGDTIYVSNYGNVRLNDIILTIGKGLWMDINGDIHIPGVSFGKYKTIYRFIYTMAVDNTFNGGHKWQIHHIDRNHSNNRYDNLIKLTGKQHLKMHQKDFMNDELMIRLKALKEYYKEQSNKRYQHIAIFNEWLTNRYNKYYNDVVIPQQEQRRKERQQQLEKRKYEKKLLKDERKKQKLIKEQQLIDAGTHFRCKDGRVMSYDHLHKLNSAGLNRDKSYITEEYKHKLSVANKGKSYKMSEETKAKIRNTINKLYAQGVKMGKRARQS